MCRRVGRLGVAETKLEEREEKGVEAGEVAVGFDEGTGFQDHRGGAGESLESVLGAGFQGARTGVGHAEAAQRQSRRIEDGNSGIEPDEGRPRDVRLIAEARIPGEVVHDESIGLPDGARAERVEASVRLGTGADAGDDALLTSDEESYDPERRDTTRACLAQKAEHDGIVRQSRPGCGGR